ncbi:MAG: pentapeptide repeat-containing protein [Hyphomonadaceae bacterium]|nr:pentapeptide repeat-containing protein [Hyphomonadaceae bacterium]
MDKLKIFGMIAVLVAVFAVAYGFLSDKQQERKLRQAQLLTQLSESALLANEGQVKKNASAPIRNTLEILVKERVPLIGVVARGADLRGADLGGADLRGADLGGADLGGADLGGADLREADLRGADLTGANLGGANLGQSNLNWTNLGGANLAEVRGLTQTMLNCVRASSPPAALPEVEILEWSFEEVNGEWARIPGDAYVCLRNLAGAHLSGVDLKGEDLAGADLTGANLRGANLREADLTEANLEGADIRGADLRRADFTDANLIWTNLADANLIWASFIGADLEGANLRNTNLTNAVLPIVDLNGANLTGADLRGADIRDSDFSWANLSDVKGLTQEMLNCVYDTPPASLPENLQWPFEEVDGKWERRNGDAYVCLEDF